MDDPKQILENGPKQTKFLTSSLEIFDINILPERYRPKKIRLVGILPWLLFLVFLTALYPSILIAQEAQSNFKRTQFQVAVLQTSLESYQSAANEMTALQDEIGITTERRDQIVASYLGIDLQGSNWSPALFRIEKNVPDGISWTSVVQQDQEIHLEGIADTYEGILDLQDILSSLGEFSKVRIDSVDQIIIDPTETVAAITEDGQPLTTLPPSYTFSLVAIPNAEGQQ